jgi:EAL domain-containing protein (putative c-di-GMP-specific phosphodiesterase class I)
VKSIISVAQNFDMKTVAEGVEDQATLDLLRTLGVDFVQGYYIGYPAEMTVASQWPAYSISPSRSALATADARSETSYFA